jgi:hypothetical protein
MFCDAGEKKPPKGFEKFHRGTKPKAEKAENSKVEAEGSKAETTKEKTSGPKETPTGKDGQNKSTKSSGSSSGSKGPKDDGQNVKLPGGVEVNRHALGMATGIAAFFAVHLLAGEG